MMVNFQNYIVLVAFVVLAAACDSKSKYQRSGTKTMEVSYFGQKKPGLFPEIFAKGIISIPGRNEYGISFSPNFDEMYYSASKKEELPSIYSSILKNGEWTTPTQMNFTKGQKAAEMEPFVSFDGNKLFFTAHNADYTDTKIWYSTRTKNTWSNAVKMRSSINDDEVFYLNQSKKGTFYYTNISKFKIYKATAEIDTVYKINDAQIEFGMHAFIAPSQEILLLDSQNKEILERKDNDIYACFRKEDGTWSKPINLGDKVNTEFDETCPSLTPDGKYLFFSRYDEAGDLSNFYWVSAEVIHRLNPVKS